MHKKISNNNLEVQQVVNARGYLAELFKEEGRVSAFVVLIIKNRRFRHTPGKK